MSEDEPKPDSPCAEVKDNNAASAVEVHRARIAEVYVQIEAPLLGALRSRVGSMQEARDIAQEACVKLMERTGTVNSLRAFLWRTALNIATDRWRQGTFRNAQTPILASEADSTSPSPEFACIALEQLAIIEKALDELPPKCRKAFILLFFENLEFTDVAERIGIDISGVRKYVARAIEHCQRAVDAAEQAKRSDI
jgi:RNA polymerase sigma factor (sigma-70 family)